MNSIDEIMHPEMVRVRHDISADHSSKEPRWLRPSNGGKKYLSAFTRMRPCIWFQASRAPRPPTWPPVVPVLIGKTFIVAMPALILARVSGDPVTRRISRTSFAPETT
jgi:hypothetical protein